MPRDNWAAGKGIITHLVSTCPMLVLFYDGILEHLPPSLDS